MIQLLKFLIIFIVTGIFFWGAVTAYAIYDYKSPGPLSEPKSVIFAKGSGFQGICDQLGAEGIIRHPLLFKAIAVLNGDARKFKPGEYAFSPAITPQLVMDMMAQGKVVVHKVTVPEGLTVLEIRKLLLAEPALDGDLPTDMKEGSLMPETYHFTRGDTRASVVARMQAAMKKTLDELWPTRAEGLPLSSPEQAVTLASIVEKETGVKEERPRVASVFINRLHEGMKLQTDPTIIYAIEKGETLKRSLTLNDLAFESPYNTYLHEGLPPGPIANPGRASIEAALHPENTQYLYFVATGTGGHHFAKTIDEHNANVAAYHKALKEKKN